MDTLWLMCGIAVVAVGLIMMIGGSSGKSLDDVYARREEARREQAPAEQAGRDTDAPTVVVASTGEASGRHRVVA